MKRIIAIILCFIFAVSLCSCGVTGNMNGGKINVVTTIFPLYDWVREIAGDSENVSITMLINSGADLHSFSPTTQDVIKISTCDMFVYVGGESDRWADDAVKENKNESLANLNLLDMLGDRKKQEKIKEGMQGEEDEEEDADYNDIEYDEHIWLSVKNAAFLCNIICEGLCKADPENAEKYKINAKNYIIKLDELDNQYKIAVESSNKKTLVFGDRFPFRYLTDDYGIDYFAAFAGCSAESEASFKTVIFLANKVDELGLKSIIKIDGSDGKLAITINENTSAKSAKILALNSMQSVTSDQAGEGLTYIGICQKNLMVLKEALE